MLSCLAISGPAFAQKKGTEAAQKNDVKFLEDITVEVTPQTTSDPKSVFSESLFTGKKPVSSTPTSLVSGSTKIENAAGLQFKYALIMDMEVETIVNLDLFRAID